MSFSFELSRDPFFVFLKPWVKDARSRNKGFFPIKMSKTSGKAPKRPQNRQLDLGFLDSTDLVTRVEFPAYEDDVKAAIF